MTDPDALIVESEAGDIYEAKTLANGLLYSVRIFRDPIGGWPAEYRQRAHDDIRAAVAKDGVSALQSQDGKP